MKHLMVDLETMGVGADAAIVAIGAVVFDPETSGLAVENPGAVFGNTFYRVVDLQSSLDAGLKVDASTVYWWLQGDEEARNALCDKGNHCDLFAALLNLNEFLEQEKPDYLWARGSDFDFPILKTAIRLFNLKPFWKYNVVRDSRTLFHVVPHLDPAVTNERIGVGHNALDDAKTEALAVIKALRYLKQREMGTSV